MNSNPIGVQHLHRASGSIAWACALACGTDWLPAVQ